MTYLGPCEDCGCAIYEDEGERIYTSDDPNCRCQLGEDRKVVEAIERGLRGKEGE